MHPGSHESWQRTALRNVLTFQRGFDITKKELVPGPYDVIFSSGIQGSHDRFKVKAPGIVIGRKGSLGTVFFAKRDFWPTDTTLWVKDFNGNDETFAYYFLQTLHLEQYDTGAANPTLNRNHIHTLPIKYPSLPLQRKIAAILSAYDDLIENNTRRIAILEDMAQAIYREWFVHFRFPGHEDVRLVESELGLVPEGWEVRRLGDVCTILMGQSPKSEFYNEIGEGLPFHQGVKDFGDRFPTDRVYCTLPKRIAEDGDILFSVRAPVGRINIANKKIVVGRGLCAIRNNTGNQNFTFHQLKEAFQEEDIIGGGTIFKSVTKDDMHSIRFLVPPMIIIERFEEIVTPISAQIENLTTRNANLRQTCDLLLPRLVSGELDVSELDIDTGAPDT